MNKLYEITAENLLASFPHVLKEDKSLYALAAATAEALASRMAEIERLRIYSRIDELPEKLLDILAYDFKVDWWDYDYSLEEKRRTLKDSWRVHRMLGTKAAVEEALSAIYPDTTVQEWFEYGGNPYTFRLTIDATDFSVDSERHRRVLDKVNYYKNLRSHLDGIRYIVRAGGIATGYAGAACLGSYTRYFVDVAINGVVDWPRIEMRAPTATAAVDLYERIAADVPVTGKVDWPHIGVAAQAAAPVLSVQEHIRTSVVTSGAVDWPRPEIAAPSGTAAKSVYQKIVTEVSVNGMES